MTMDNLATSTDQPLFSFQGIRVLAPTALVFFATGIFLGAMNALRMAGIIKYEEIHYLHWNTALLGGVTLILLLQLFAYLSNAGILKQNATFPMVFMVSWILVVLLNYATIFNWIPSELTSILFMALAISLVYPFALLFNAGKNSSESGHHYHFMFGIFWQIIALFFFESLVRMNPIFLFCFVYGFFTNFLFGGIFLFLPVLFKQKALSRGSLKLHAIVHNTGTLLGAIYEYLQDLGGMSFDWVFNLLSTIVWFLAFLIFFFWYGDFIYKTGLNSSLFGVSIGMVMYALFLFDSFVGAVLPSWVGLRHVHVLFVGSLVITISSVGWVVMKMEMKVPIELEATWDFNELKSDFLSVKGLLLLFVILGAASVLFFFTLQEYKFVAYAGFVLVTSFVLNQAVAWIKAK